MGGSPFVDTPEVGCIQANRTDETATFRQASRRLPDPGPHAQVTTSTVSKEWAKALLVAHQIFTEYIVGDDEDERVTL